MSETPDSTSQERLSDVHENFEAYVREHATAKRPPVWWERGGVGDAEADVSIIEGAIDIPANRLHFYSGRGEDFQRDQIQFHYDDSNSFGDGHIMTILDTEEGFRLYLEGNPRQRPIGDNYVANLLSKLEEVCPVDQQR